MSREDHRLLARRGEAALHAAGLPAPARRPPTRSSTRTSSSVLEFRIGDVRDYATSAASLRDADIVFNAAAHEASADLRVLSRRGGPHQHATAPRTSCAPSRNTTLRSRRWSASHRQGVQAGQRDGHDEGDSGAHVHRRPTCAARDALRLRALRQRPRVARLGDSAVSRSDSARRPVTITTTDMTRFLLSLDEAVDTVFAAIRGGRRGETFMPRAPSARVVGHRHGADRRAADRDDRHRHPARREDPRDHGLARKRRIARSSAATTTRSADAARSRER